jgi:hypothetical protein
MRNCRCTYTHRETCEACKDHFVTTKARARWCRSCKAILEEERTILQSLIDLTGVPHPQYRREARDELEDALRCPLCGWTGNRDRTWPRDPRSLHKHIEHFVIADLKHRMRHAFPGRFLISRKFTPKWIREETQFYRRLYQELEDKWRDSTKVP